MVLTSGPSRRGCPAAIAPASRPRGVKHRQFEGTDDRSVEATRRNVRGPTQFHRTPEGDRRPQASERVTRLRTSQGGALAGRGNPSWARVGFHQWKSLQPREGGGAAWAPP